MADVVAGLEEFAETQAATMNQQTAAFRDIMARQEDVLERHDQATVTALAQVLDEFSQRLAPLEAALAEIASSLQSSKRAAAGGEEQPSSAEEAGQATVTMTPAEEEEDDAPGGEEGRGPAPDEAAPETGSPTEGEEAPQDETAIDPATALRSQMPEEEAGTPEAEPSLVEEEEPDSASETHDAEGEAVADPSAAFAPLVEAIARNTAATAETASTLAATTGALDRMSESHLVILGQIKSGIEWVGDRLTALAARLPDPSPPRPNRAPQQREGAALSDFERAAELILQRLDRYEEIFQASVRELGEIRGASRETLMERLKLAAGDLSRRMAGQDTALKRLAWVAVAALAAIGFPAMLALGVLAQQEFALVPPSDPTNGWKDEIWSLYGHDLASCVTRERSGKGACVVTIE